MNTFFDTISRLFSPSKKVFPAIQSVGFGEGLSSRLPRKVEILDRTPGGIAPGKSEASPGNEKSGREYTAIWRGHKYKMTAQEPLPQVPCRPKRIGYWRGVPYEISAPETRALAKEVRIGYWRGQRFQFQIGTRRTIISGQLAG